MLADKIYNLVLYNHGIKKIAQKLLKTPLLIKSAPYRFYYCRTMRDKMRGFSKMPLRVMMENTNLCNADCTFCPHKSMKRGTGIMEMELSKKIIDQCKDNGIEYVTIYGFGEPFLDKDFFKRVEYAKIKGIKRVTTNTNAAYLDSAKNQKLIQSGIDEVYISFDAFKEETYGKIRPNLDFYAVKENIMDLVERRDRAGKSVPLVVLSFVENEINRKETKDYLNYWKKKVNYISISSAHNWTGRIKGYSAESSCQKDPCRLLWTDMFILYNGDVALCCNDYEGKVIIGNIKESSISEIWSAEKITKIRESHINSRYDEIPLCKDCNYNYHHKSNWWVSK